MVLTERDLVPTKPIIKKPKTFNPLGAIFAGLFIGIGHFLINNSFLTQDANPALGGLGIFFLVLSIPIIMLVISLSTKHTLFITRIETTKSISSQSALQIMNFYIGFMPIYGFTVAFGSAVRNVDDTLLSTVEFYRIGVVSAIIIVLVASVLILNMQFFQKEKVSLGDLKQFLFQPKKIIFSILCLLITLISTIIFVFI